MTRLGQMIEKDGREKERIALNTLNKITFFQSH